jgi:succinate dehydrogenase/fumarate reductase flavoprotein subunit
MEFTMFSPHTMMEPGLPMWYLLPCEARLHSVYRNSKGERFLDRVLGGTGADVSSFQKRYGELSSDIREVISRAVAIEIFEGRGDGDSIYLDFSEVPESYWEADLPSRYNLRCLIRGFDWKKSPIRISPGALTHLGGIEIDTWGRTNLNNLYACGEATAPVHGARRRGGNAFTECVVFGARSGRAAASNSKKGGKAALPYDRDAISARVAEILSWNRPANEIGTPADIRKRIQTTMWYNAGPLRTKDRLDRSAAELSEIRQEQLPYLHARTPFEVKAAVEAIYMLDVAELITQAAQFRTESRGAHYRADFPNLDNDNWLCQSVLTRGKEIGRKNINVTRLPLPVKKPERRVANA